MANRTDLIRISKKRLQTVNTLVKTCDWQMSAYMMAMCLEISLKALICKKLNILEYPDNHKSKSINSFFKTHNFADLSFVSGLNPILSARDEAGIFNEWNNFLDRIPGNNWPDIRYLSDIKLTKKDIDSMYLSLLAILKEIKKRW